MQYVFASYENCDIVLTPNETIHAPGKTMFYDDTAASTASAVASSAADIDAIERTQLDGDEVPVKAATIVSNDKVPWEKPLKHALYLVLNNKIDEQWNGR